MSAMKKQKVSNGYAVGDPIAAGKGCEVVLGLSEWYYVVHSCGTGHLPVHERMGSMQAAVQG